MSDIRPVSRGPSLDGYYQQLINHIHILRLAINADATEKGATWTRRLNSWFTSWWTS